MKFAKFIKKPVVIWAFQFTGYLTKDLIDWCEEKNIVIVFGKKDKSPSHLLIPTKEGIMRASAGDWIIYEDDKRCPRCGVYPCKPKIFKKTYRRVR